MGRWPGCNHVFSVRHLVLAALCVHVLLHDVLIQSATATTYWYTGASLTALQTLWLDWSQSTPDLAINLAGWKNNPSGHYCPCYNESWGGVLCINVPVPSAMAVDTYNVLVIGLTMNDASLVGTLPPAIGDLSDLVTLSLSGNPNLTGSLPLSLGNLASANVLDLHDNGFTGTIPSLSKLVSLQTLDLSGNHLTGRLPSTFSTLQWLRTLKLSNNKLTGKITYGLLQNMPYLVSVDLSDNMLNGALPDLTSAPSLHTLNVSRNQFSGIVSMSIFNSSSIMNFTKLDLSHNNFSGPLPDFGSWSGLQALDLSYNNFKPRSFSTWVSKLNQTSLQFLGLQGMNLTGEVPSSTLKELTKLKHLYMDYNNMDGTFDLDSMYSNNTTQHITFFSLTNNNITHVNYTGSSVTKFGTTFNLTGNPYCLDNSTLTSDLGKCLCKQICYDTPPDYKILAIDGYKRKVVIIVSSISVTFCVAVVIISGILYHRSRRYKNYLMLQLNQKFSEHELKPTLFAFHDLMKATQNFHPDMKLGEGAFGAVYKGYLQGKVEVAVKQLNTGVQQSALDDFLNEVFLLSAVKHKNLVKLKGCCLRETQRLLVYEFVENNDLSYLLLDGHGKHLLTWALRMQICLGVAKGLHYLHALVQPRIVHRDIKASNILLDKNLEPKIADFGLALLFPEEGNSSHIMMTTVAGTKGYLAPEYVFEGRLSEKVDVYSFGVVLLEVVSGRKNIDPNVSPDKTYLPRWAWERYNEGTPMDILDPTLHLHEDDQKEVLRVIEVAFVCVQETPEKRPSMAHVIAMLQGDMEVSIDEVNQRRPLFTWNPLAKGSDYASTMEDGASDDQRQLHAEPLSSWSVDLSSVAQSRA